MVLQKLVHVWRARGGVAMQRPRCLWPVGAVLGETPVWDAAAQRLAFIDGACGRLHSCGVDGGARRSTALPPPLGFVARGRNGWWIGSGLSIGFLADAGQTLETLAVLPGDGAALRVNDAGVDAAGCLWTGTMDREGRAPAGALYRFAPDGAWRCVAGDFTIPNGFRFSPDGRFLYVADSPLRVVYRYDCAGDGGLARRTVFATFTEEDGYPDGMAFDSAGGLWVAHYGGGCITRFRPDGTRDRRIALPVKNVTALAFGGADLRTLFVTTAQSSGDKREPREAGGLFAVPCAETGAVLPLFGAV